MAHFQEVEPGGTETVSECMCGCQDYNRELSFASSSSFWWFIWGIHFAVVHLSALPINQSTTSSDLHLLC